MEASNMSRERKLRVILCGPLSRTEHALLRRGDVEIIQGSSINLLVEMSNNGCDMLIVHAPYGHGLYSMTYPVREGERCPAWMVGDPPDETVWREINLQLDEVPAKREKAREKAIAVGPPRHEILMLADTPERRSDLTGWMEEIRAAGNEALPPLNVPEDVKEYLREMRWPCAPPEAVVIAMTGVDSLKTAEHIRRFFPKVGLIWCCDLDFSLQAYHLDVDYFFLLSEASARTLGIGLNRAYHYNKRGNTYEKTNHQHHHRSGPVPEPLPHLGARSGCCGYGGGQWSND